MQPKEIYTRQLADVIAREEAYLRRHRAENGTEGEQDATSAKLTNKWGLCISGGGIRSATLGLGMLQKFMRDGVYKYFDYMCTVSGGGYIGACVSSLLSNPNTSGVENAHFVTTEGEKVPLGVDRNTSPFLSRGKYVKDQREYTPKHQLNHLLTHGEYLSRNRSVFSLDIKRLLSAVLGGAISNIVLLILMAFMLVSGTLLYFQLIGGDIVLTYSFDSVFDSSGRINWGFLTELPNGRNFWHWVRVCFWVGVGFTFLFYLESRFYVLQNLGVKDATGVPKGEKFKYGRLVVYFKKLNVGDLRNPDKRSVIAQKATQFYEYAFEKIYASLRNGFIRFVRFITFQKKRISSLDRRLPSNIHMEDYLVQQRVSRFALWSTIVSVLLVSGIILYQRWIYNDDSIRLILTLPIFFTAGSLLFMFLLGMTPQAPSKYERTIRSIYTGMYGGAFNAIVAALVVPFAIVGIYFFNWSSYGISSPMSLIAPATTYLIADRSGLFNKGIFKGFFERILPRLRLFVLNLSVLIFLFLVFQLLAKYIMNPDNAIHYGLRDETFAGLGSRFLFWFAMGCSLFAILFVKIDITANPLRVAFLNYVFRLIRNPLRTLLSIGGTLSAFLGDMFVQVRQWRFVLVYFAVAAAISGLLVWINNQLDNYLMDFIPLLVILLLSFTAILVGYFFTLKRGILYNSIVLLVVLGVLLYMTIEIWTGNAQALQTDIQQYVNLNLTPATYFIASVLLTLILGFFFIRRYRGTILKFYQDRLTESFLITDGLMKNTEYPMVEGGDLQKRLRNHEKLCLHQVGENNYKAPYHILLAALNLQSKYTYLRKDLKSEHFIFSKYYLGSKRTGYVSSEIYEDDGQPMHLSTAMTISAAAVNSAMGTYGFFAQTFFVTLFNLRLGKWINNPLHYASKSKIASQTNRRVNGISNLLREYTGMFSTTGRSVNVSDGGHTGDNLGLLPLLQRRCSTIVVCDFEEDKNFTFGALNTVLRMAYVEEGIWIHLDLSELMPLEENGVETKKSVAVGTIYYPDEKRGKIIYIKSSLSGNLATNIWGYHRKNPDFPHQTTADQYFDGAQYEAYRSLGYDLAEMSVDILKLRRSVEAGSIVEPDDYEDYLNAQSTMHNEIMINGIRQLTYEQLEEWQQAHRPYELIDVREPQEHEVFNVGGKNIPLNEVIKRQNEIDYSKPVVVYCKRGIRSAIAIQRLQKHYEHVRFYNLNRGILDIMSTYNQVSDLEEE